MLLIPKLDDKSPIPQYLQLVDYIKREIASGRLAEQTRLPSIRALADYLSLSPTPVELAYNQLAAEGFIASVPRQGYYVQHLPEPYLGLGIGDAEPQRHSQADAVTKRAAPARDARTYPYDFHLSSIDGAHFPYRVWRSIFQELLVPERKELLWYGDPQGEPGLREQIAKYAHQFRGVRCTKEQVIVGSDPHVLLTMLAKLLRKHAGHIAVENPGYLLCPATFRQQGYEVTPVSLEDDGIHIGELYDSAARIVCVSPSHQFPRGMIMPIAKRLQLLEWARRTNGFIIEDDIDGELRYYGRPIPSLQGLLPESDVIYLGGFAQVLAPAVGIHYMILPPSLLEAYQVMEYYTLFEQSAPRWNQHALQLFMERGHLERHVRRMRTLYRNKHDRLITAIRQHFGARADITGTDAGFHMLMRFESPHSDQELVRRAREAGIRLASAAFTWLRPPAESRQEFFLGFGGIPIDRIDEGICRLSEVWIED
ncbi:MAG: PLP-dependent aminotransferase family protein [Paenibacillus dendritiformis]|uniref:MocR-like pyridoxine biosynthesis transcription factor PdxR n=1 Tax=uncultured Paenibacillus sp. TaxID=227322 RepID=UPI0025E89A4F|nr:PLP-dependent aminotransferase family protein [uncultured Paenibacillus sp.]MDU5142596.1 PLP-dependent aminotransferase family protein [Paenibacillus dendritiformis]